MFSKNLDKCDRRIYQVLHHHTVSIAIAYCGFGEKNHYL